MLMSQLGKNINIYLNWSPGHIKARIPEITSYANMIIQQLLSPYTT